MYIRIGSYLPFKVTLYMNGHSYIEPYQKNAYGKKALYKKRENVFLSIKDIHKLKVGKVKIIVHYQAEKKRGNYFSRK